VYNRTGAYLAAILAMAFFAFSYVWFKIANETYGPVTIVFSRLVIAITFLSLYLLLTRGFEKIRKGDMKYFILLALCEPFLYFIFEGYGLEKVSSTVAAVIVSIIPVFTAIGGQLIFGERLRAINYLGIAISFSGILVFMLTGESNLSFHPTGIILMLLAVLCATGYSLLLRKLVHAYSPIFIVNTQNIIGATLFLPLFMIIDGGQIPTLVFDKESVKAIIQLAVFASCGSFILLGYSVRVIGIARANLFANLLPVITALYAFRTLGESVTLEKYAGIIIMIAGLTLSQVNGQSLPRGKTPIS
jgi:drug/metabolite transporter (DMT)-like permease